ncbi:fucolectin-like [Amblyraja radiata]|uniref:fucolectin-like n=1 Tax=Amblyraja radiata TaxID=386614 RepID=UPI001402EBDE|nr:fucolectin-like [Amblyraja radiata]
MNKNVAFGALPTQSSTYQWATAERANDGNSDSNFRHGSCTQTNKSKNPWWRVDLIHSYNVSGVRISNRADCCSDRLQGAEIRIGDSVSNDDNRNRLCGTVDSVSLITLNFNCGGIVGRYVTIIIPGYNKTLTLCEVDIIGSELPSLLGSGNVASGGRPTQSSTYAGAGAHRANDGNSDIHFRSGSCSRTRKSTNPWWRIDLIEIYNVSDVIITNRADCCSFRLLGAEIHIGNSLENDGNSNRL